MSARRPAPGFTLVELLVATVVLLGVLLAVGKIFSTTSKVTGLGEGNADVLQEAAAIGQQLRDDLANLTREAPFAIRCVAVRNDVNGAALLNPSLPPDAEIRADQLVFFTHAPESVRVFRTGNDARQRAQGVVSRIYYGHGFQLGDKGLPVQKSGVPKAFDVAPDQVVYPWTSSAMDGSIRTTRTIFDGGGIFNPQAPSTIQLTPPDARRWLLVRQPVVLIDDDYTAANSAAKTDFLGELLTARSVFRDDSPAGRSMQIRDGRVDAAASKLPDIRRYLQEKPSGDPRPWSGSGGVSGSVRDQFSIIAEDLVYYPRAERVAPSMDRVDQALTNHVIGTACSSFRVDWTYADGVGFVVDGTGAPRQGVVMPRSEAVQWFGLPDVDRGVMTYEQYGESDDDRFLGAETIFPENVERMPPVSGAFRVYEAAFGYNRSIALDATGQPHVDVGYTPWPTALRITITVHDPALNLEAGREIEFVITLPGPDEK